MIFDILLHSTSPINSLGVNGDEGAKRKSFQWGMCFQLAALRTKIFSVDGLSVHVYHCQCKQLERAKILVRYSMSSLGEF